MWIVGGQLATGIAGKRRNPAVLLAQHTKLTHVFNYCREAWTH